MKKSPVFTRLFEQVISIPVIDCHEHLRVVDGKIGTMYCEPIQALAVQYLNNDFYAAGASSSELELLQNPSATTDQKWPAFSRLWQACQYTAYGRVTRYMLQRQYGIKELTRASLDRVAAHLAEQSPAKKLKLLESANIKAVISDWLFPPPRERQIRYFTNPVISNFIENNLEIPGIIRSVFNLPYFHELRTRDFVDWTGQAARVTITSLGDYEEAVFELIQRSQQKGIVALKDQSAYRRSIDFSLPERCEAERLFNRLMIDPRNQLAWPDAKPLDDYLFHQLIRFARQLQLPVQVHTGHVSGNRNRVDKTNAALFASTLELHGGVQFDLFHGNWPYLGDLLFLGKNYANVALDLCWLYIIDPNYARELIKRAVMTVPHVKVHAFGGDYWDAPEYSVAHLDLAREVIAGAFADLVEEGWLEENQAVDLATGWLYNNPNRFYNLGLPDFEV